MDFRNYTKKIFALISFVILCSATEAQGVAVSEDGSPAHASAMLDVKAARKGVLVPRMDSAGRKNIVSPANGLMVFDTTYKAFYYYTAGKWNALFSESNKSTIAFRAIRKTNFTTATSVRMAFDSVEYDTDNSYTSTFGYFEAPVDGVYHFDASVAIQTNGLFMNLSLYKTSNAATNRIFTNRLRPRDGFSQTNSINITLLLKKNDRIAVWIEPGSASFPATVTPTFFDDTFFAGFKVN